MIHIYDQIWFTFLVAPVVTTPGWNSDGSFLSSASQSGICWTIKRRPEIQSSTLSSSYNNIVRIFWLKRQQDRDSIVGESRTTPPPLSLHTGGEKKSSRIIIRKNLNAVFRNCSSESCGKHFLTSFFAFSKPFKNCRPDINDFEILFVSSNRSSCSHAALF